MLHRRTVIGGVAAVGILVAGGTAYTAGMTNSIAATTVGDTSVTASGGSLTGVSYNLDGTDHTLVNSLQVGIQTTAKIGNADQVQTKVGSAAWTTCTAAVLTEGETGPYDHSIVCPLAAPAAANTVTSIKIVVNHGVGS